MKICIPIPARSQGGVYTFLANWRAWLDGQGIEHTDNISDPFDILFVNSWVVQARIVKRVKKARPEIRVVHRVDGSGQDYGRSDDADIRQARVNQWADLTIFQSHYSRFSTMQKYKIITLDGPVIYNPVNVERFRPSENKFSLFTACNAAFSPNRKKGTWQIGEIARQNPEVHFVLCGRYPPLPRLPNIELLGHLNRKELAVVMQQSHVFLNLSENDPCPNVVTEALASGLPVLYKDSGGTPELVGDCGLPATIDSLRQQLKLIQEKYETWATKARQRAVREFSPEIIFPQYLAAIKAAERRPLPTWQDMWRDIRAGYLLVPRRPGQVVWMIRRAALAWRNRWQN
jgi:glycosyltransferase involved in cell wall biosynthesis